MRFLNGSGKTLQRQIEAFPWLPVFAAAKILVVGFSEDNRAVAACGIRSLLNVLTLYIRRQYRGQGLGKIILGQALGSARKRGLSFILLGVYSNNPSAYRLYSKAGFKQVVQIKRPEMTFMMLPLSGKGELAYKILKTICSVLPKSLLSGFAQWFEAKTVGISEG